MKYVIVTINWLTSKGIIVPESARKSVNGEKVILHKEFILPILMEDDVIEEYEYDNSSLMGILSSEEWSINESNIQ